MFNKTVVFLSVGLLCSVNAFADDVVLAPNTVTPSACVVENTGVYSGEFTMVPVYVDTAYNCAQGEYLPHGSEECATCPENSYCPGGNYAYSDDTDRGITACADGLYSPAGMWESAQCGHILHLGEYVVYLRATAKTEQAMAFEFDDGTFYANVTADDVPMHNGTTRQLKVSDGENIWSLYDDTVTPAG